MLFLNDFIKHRATTGNLSLSSPEPITPEDTTGTPSRPTESNSSSESPDVTTVPTPTPDSLQQGTPSSTSTAVQGPKRKGKSGQGTNVDDFEENIMTSIQSLTSAAKGFLLPAAGNQQVEMDEDDYFAATVSASLRKLPPRTKGYAKMVIQQTLWQLEFSPESPIQLPSQFTVIARPPTPK